MKYPTLFLFRLVSYIDYFSDDEITSILKNFITLNFDYCISVNLKLLFQNELINKNNSWNILDNFYKLINKKFLITIILNKFYKIYDNKNFWNLSSLDQYDYLNNLFIYFLSLFDCSRGGTPLHIKLQSLNLNDEKFNITIIDDIRDRLKKILKIFGTKLFNSLNIPLISENDLYYYNSENIIIYLTLIFNKIYTLLNQTIKLFNSYISNSIEIDKLLTC